MIFLKRHKNPLGKIVQRSAVYGLFGNLTRSNDLMAVSGPEDGSSVCSDWVGAVVSVSGRSSDFPPLVEAVADGLFHPGCRHHLTPYVPVNDEVGARFCTKFAVSAMESRRETPTRNTPEPRESKDARWVEKKRSEFEHGYSDAQRAETAGDIEQALASCQKALAMLLDYDLFGTHQARVERALKGRIQTILSRQIQTIAE